MKRDCPTLNLMRLFVWSDLHVDYVENFRLLRQLSRQEYCRDALLVAGDLSSDHGKVMQALDCLRERFAEVAFVPGNHDLWVTLKSRSNSLEKLHQLRAACLEHGIRTSPFSIKTPGQVVRIVPLFSWYVKPEEGDGSLYLPKAGEDPTLAMWADNRRIRWPPFGNDESPASHLLALNDSGDSGHEGLVVTFSHFLPRVELVFHDWERFRRDGKSSGIDPHPEFNFTRVAGCRQLDDRIRGLGSGIHVYGHQHRNRDRVINGVRYVSHSLGYPGEWQARETNPHGPLPLELSVDRQALP